MSFKDFMQNVQNNNNIDDKFQKALSNISIRKNNTISIQNNNSSKLQKNSNNISNQFGQHKS